MTLRCRPGQAGTHTPQRGDVAGPAITETFVVMGPRLRGDDSGESLLHIFFRGNERRLVQWQCKPKFITIWRVRACHLSCARVFRIDIDIKKVTQA